MRKRPAEALDAPARDKRHAGFFGGVGAFFEGLFNFKRLLD